MDKDEDSNKLIVEFMGAIAYKKAAHSHCFKKAPSGIPSWSDNYLTIGDLQYNTSWDWLMPVVEKIESIWDDFHGYFGVHISSNSCCIQGTKLNTTIENPHYAYFNEVVADTKIQATWQAVTGFIQWYNNNTQD